MLQDDHRKYLLLPDLIIASKVDRVLQPLGQHNLETNLAIDLDIAKEVDHILSANQGQASEDKDEGLDERSSLGAVQTGSNSLEKLGQERTKPFMASLLNQLSSDTTNLRGSIVLDTLGEQTVDNA